MPVELTINLMMQIPLTNQFLWRSGQPICGLPQIGLPFHNNVVFFHQHFISHFMLFHHLMLNLWIYKEVLFLNKVSLNSLASFLLELRIELQEFLEEILEGS